MTKVEKLVIRRIGIVLIILILAGCDIYRGPGADMVRWSIRLLAIIGAGSIFAGTTIGYGKVLASRRRAAVNIVAIRNKLYSEAPHTYRTASLDHFPHLDRGFYETSRKWFESQGFRLAGDLENVTMTQAFAKANSSVLRFFLDNDGAVVGAAFHAILSALPGRPAPEVRRIEFGTEFSDGTYLCTTTAHEAHRSRYPGIVMNLFPPSTAPAELLRHHLDAVAQKVSSKSGITATRCRDLEDIIQVSHREHALKARFKHSLDWGAEREAQAGRPLNERERALAEEIRRVKGGT